MGPTDTDGRGPREPDAPRVLSLAAFLAVLAVLSAAAPLFAVDVPSFVGGLLIVTALTEALHGIRRSTLGGLGQAWGSASITVGLAILLLGAPFLAGAALATLIAGWFALDVARWTTRAWRARGSRREAGLALLAAAGNLAVVLLLGGLHRKGLFWLIGLAGAFRIAGTAWTTATAPRFTSADVDDTVLFDIGLSDHPAMVARARALSDAEASRALVDAGWLVAFVLTLFAIHIGRMGLDRTALGVFSPFAAVMGDLVFALLFAFVLVIPLRLAFRRATRGLERAAWSWVLSPPSGRGWSVWLRQLTQLWLDERLCFSIRVRSARYSLPLALSRGLQIGLPLAAIMAATVPIWGMSWYFDTENWAAGAWNSWAERRTDTWREAMVDAVVDAKLSTIDAQGFSVNPGGLDGDFSFLVIGDTGEGDASQHVLRDSLIRAAAHEDVRFVVLSSDVVYPTGAMRDYEPRFWLPFKGVAKPVYAIPGNHDWYDALDGFVATFFTPAAARIAMRARVDADNNLSSTTDDRVDELIAKAGALRASYRVPTGFQQGTFFQVQSRDFALIALDTGVLKRVDEKQMAWLEAALEASRGKTLMVVLGHPLYAGGHRQWDGNEDFTAIKTLIDRYGARIVMAGDTHDLEYYREDPAGPGGRGTEHFVNGGGGAYLSFGTALAWPATPATGAWAFYPSTAQVTAKIQAETPWWKRPAWWWTREFGAWPFSAEWLSAAFDYNTAPFFQSFVEVRVEPSARRVRLIPWGIYGPLRRGDLQSPVPPGERAGEPMEWVVPMDE